MTSTLDYVKQILDEEMQLPAGRCFAYNSPEELPKDNNLFICLFFAERSPYANNVKYEYKENSVIEKHNYNVAEDIVIACMSKNTQARNRVQEVLMAFNSSYAQCVQEKHKFHLSLIGDVLENSFLESTSRLFRFDVRVRVIRSYEKQKEVSYYDKFPNGSKLEIDKMLYN